MRRPPVLVPGSGAYCEAKTSRLEKRGHRSKPQHVLGPAFGACFGDQNPAAPTMHKHAGWKTFGRRSDAARGAVVGLGTRTRRRPNSSALAVRRLRRNVAVPGSIADLHRASARAPFLSKTAVFSISPGCAGTESGTRQTPGDCKRCRHSVGAPTFRRARRRSSEILSLDPTSARPSVARKAQPKPKIP